VALTRDEIAESAPAFLYWKAAQMGDAPESVKAPTGWAIGLRVTRPDDDRSGTIVGIDRQIKVKWDNGRTSYYPRSMPGIQIAEK
jgi:hypothetical protein